MKVLVVPDKFKGTLTAAEAARAIAAGWRSARPEDEVCPLPMSDGGDGFGEIISALLGATARSTETVDAAHRPVTATWWWHDASRTAIIESARVIGLAQLPRGKFHPFDLDTRGLGIVLRTAAQQSVPHPGRVLNHLASPRETASPEPEGEGVAGAARCIVGIGGSATNDAGFGCARELGWEFHDARGAKLTRWTELENLARVTRPALLDPTADLHESGRLGTAIPTLPLSFAEIIVAVDVQNPLLGPEGCSRVYGPQKGLRPEDFPLAERCLERLAGVLREQHGLDFASTPGAGAAGGLGFGLCSFAGAKISLGFDLFANYARLKDRLRDTDLVITAEGAIDRQTLMGKGVGQIATLCAEHKLPCIGLAGVVEEREAAAMKFYRVHALTDLTTSEEAMSHAAAWLERLATRAAEQLDFARGR